MAPGSLPAGGLLVLSAHGDTGGEGAFLEQAGQAADGLSRRWAKVLGRTGLVLAGSCALGGGPAAAILPTLALRAGAGAELAPLEPLGREAWTWYGTALVAQLGAGASVLEATQHAGAEVAGRAVLHPDSHWYRLALWSSAKEGLTASLRPAQGWWSRALSLAREEGQGFVGVERLPESGLTGQGPQIARVMRSARSAVDELRRRRGRLVAQGPTPETPSPTPRMARLLAELGQEAQAEQAAAWLLADPGTRALLAWSPVDEVGTATLSPSTRLAGTAEVLGGPECGHRFPWVEGGSFGRAPRGEEGPGCLFGCSAWRDPFLSRTPYPVDGEGFFAEAPGGRSASASASP